MQHSTRAAVQHSKWTAVQHCSGSSLSLFSRHIKLVHWVYSIYNNVFLYPRSSSAAQYRTSSAALYRSDSATQVGKYNFISVTVQWVHVHCTLYSAEQAVQYCTVETVQQWWTISFRYRSDIYCTVHWHWHWHIHCCPVRLSAEAQQCSLMIKC